MAAYHDRSTISRQYRQSQPWPVAPEKPEAGRNDQAIGLERKGNPMKTWTSKLYAITAASVLLVGAGVATASAKPVFAAKGIVNSMPAASPPILRVGYYGHGHRYGHRYGYSHYNWPNRHHYGYRSRYRSYYYGGYSRPYRYYGRDCYRGW